eukprot:4376879-Pyramimonas_sp.AAC.2
MPTSCCSAGRLIAPNEQTQVRTSVPHLHLRGLATGGQRSRRNPHLQNGWNRDAQVRGARVHTYVSMCMNRALERGFVRLG